MNTKIEYFHRDEFNNKTYYEAILEGSMTDEQEEEILNCIDEEGAFIPSSYGLSGDFDCDWSGYSTSNLPATNSMTVEDFIRRVREHVDAWKREFVPPKEGLKPYAVTIKEVYCKTVIVWAEDNNGAEEQAHERCSSDEIEFEPDDFVDRETSCDGIAQADDLRRFEIYGGRD